MLIDLDRQVFVLDDHRVGGTALLPTVMALDALAAAALRHLGQSDGVVELADVVVGSPVLFPGDGARTLEVAGAPLGPVASGVRCRLVDTTTAPGTTYYSAVVRHARTPPQTDQRVGAAELPLRPGNIYPPYFHGPEWRVVGGAAVGTRSADARMSEVIGPSSWATGATVTAPKLLELGLQTCGLWELVTSGRMMIPRSLERVTVHVAEASLGQPFVPPVCCHVDARQETDGTTAFDGWVDGPAGRLLTFHGYRTADLGQSIPAAALREIRAVAGAERLDGR